MFIIITAVFNVYMTTCGNVTCGNVTCGNVIRAYPTDITRQNGRYFGLAVYKSHYNNIYTISYVTPSYE